MAHIKQSRPDSGFGFQGKARIWFKFHSLNSELKGSGGFRTSRSRDGAPAWYSALECSGFKLRVQNSGFRLSVQRLETVLQRDVLRWGLGARVYGTELRMHGSGCRV